MGWIIRDYRCECGHEWESLVRTESQDKECAECGVMNHYTISATSLATYSMMSKDDQAKHLRKRSRDHTKKMLKKDPTSMKMSRHVTGKKK